MIRILNSPISPDDKSPEVANLQDALLLLLKRGVIHTSGSSSAPTPDELARILEQLGNERTQSIYGDTTRRLIVALQQRHGLGDDLGGAVDERTAEIINKLLKKLGALEEEQRWVIKGSVFAAGKAKPNVTVAAYDRDLRKRQPLGRPQKTNAAGAYRIEYTQSDFQLGDRGHRPAPWLIVEATAEGLPPATFEKSQGVEHEETVDLVLDVPVGSELERMLDALWPILDGQADDGTRLPLTELKADDVEFLSTETALPLDQLLLFVLAAQTAHEVQLLDTRSRHETDQPAARKKKDSRTTSAADREQLRIDNLERIAFYGWFREGQPKQFAELIERPTHDLMASLEVAISNRIIPSLPQELKDAIRSSLERRRIDETLKPAPDGGRASLGDILGTMPSRLSADKQRAVASILIDPDATTNTLATQLKELDFNDKEIANVRVTLELGDLTMRHVPLVRHLQTLRGDGTDGSIQYLTSLRPVEWLTLAYEHGTPASVAGGPEAYAEQLEREVESRFPTAVFAARAKIGQLELRDPALKPALNFLSTHPDLELKDQNIRAYLNGLDQTVANTDVETLSESLQKVQRVQKLSQDWREAGALLNAGFDSSLNVTGYDRELFIEAVRDDVPSDRADEIYTRAIEIHDTTVALIGDLYARESPWTPEILRRPKDTAGPPEEVADELPDKYPNIRRLFGNLTTCACEHCQSILSPAAYLVDLMRFLGPPRGGRNISYQALHYLLQRRPDIAHIELTCKNTNTEIPYIDLVLEVLENAIGLPIEISSPYGFDPAQDLSIIPLPDTVTNALRKVLQLSAISVGDQLQVEALTRSTFNQWSITDGSRHWTLLHSPELMRTPRHRLLPTADAAQAAARLDQGELPDPAWVFEYASEWDKNLPVTGTPVVTTLKPGQEWTIQSTRSALVELQMAAPMGAVVLKTRDGQEQLDQAQVHNGMLQPLVSRLTAGTLGEPILSMLPPQLNYQITPVGNGWQVAVNGSIRVVYQPERLVIDSLTYQSSDSREDLKASPENRNPEAYRKLNAAVYPWSLPFDLWLEEVRVFLERRGVSRRELMWLCNPDGGTTDDAVVRETLGLSLAEWSILSSPATNGPWIYWGLNENANRLTDSNDGRAVTGSWLQVLARVSILLQQSGLNFRELLNVIQTRFVRKQAPLLEPIGDACNPSKMGLANLKKEHLDRVHRLVRLWRKLGWSVFDLDLAISAVTNDSMDLDTATLRGLAQIKRLHELLGLPIYEIASWWATLTASYRDHISEKKPVLKSIYERLFLNPLIVNPADGDFSLNDQATELAQTASALASKTSIVTAALGITQSELQTLVADLVARQEMDVLSGQVDRPSLTLKNLSLLYRHNTIARSLRLSIGEYLRVRSLIGRNPLAGVPYALRFVEIARFIAQSGFSVDELDYLMRYTTDGAPTSLFTVAYATQTLSDVRNALRSVRKETFGSAEPLRDHFRKTLTRIGWYEELVEEAVELFVPSGRFEVQIAGETPVNVTIPAALNDRIIYRTQDRTLIASIGLTAAEWASLRSANSAVVDVTDAVDELRLKVDTFSTALPATLLRLQSFELPTFKVKYDSPTPLSIPNELTSRCYFDTDSRSIVLRGWMTERDKTVLLNSLPAADAVIADQLKQASDQYTEPAGPNRFISGLDQVVPFFSAPKTSEVRVGEVLELLRPYLYRRALVEQLGRALDLDDNLVGELLQTQLKQKTTLEALLDSAFTESDERILPTAGLFPAQFRALSKLHKAAFLSKKLNINAPELKWLPTSSGLQKTFDVLSLEELPSADGDTAPALAAWQQLVRLFTLRDRGLIGPLLIQRIMFLLNAQSPIVRQQDVDAQHAYLAQTLRAPVDDIRWAAVEELALQWPVDYVDPDSVAQLFPLLISTWLARALELSRQDGREARARLNLAWPADFQNPRKVTELLELLLATQRLGATCSDLFTLIEDAAEIGNSPRRPGRIEATLARSLLRARYDERAWPTALKRIVDTLREAQRNAVVSYLITHPPANAVNRGAWKNANDLYEHYLIDTQMGPCKASTRILHAISAVQLFVQRCLMNLEEDVLPSVINVERWKWMKNYRVWEANRKVFLYPENWIEPELRDDKSEIFEELEGQLLQNELDHERAKEILKGYLKQLEDVAQLAVVGMYIEKPTGSAGSPTSLDDAGAVETHVHIVARTRNSPTRFFYRRWIFSSNTHWTPWEHIPLDGVKTEHILPFVLRGDPYIAWPEITQLATAPGRGTEDDRSPGTKWRLQMSWIRRTNQGWSDRLMTSGAPLEHNWLPGKDESGTFTFRVLKDLGPPQDQSLTTIDCLAAVEETQNRFSFNSGRQTTFKLNPWPFAWNQISYGSPQEWMVVRFSGLVKFLYTDNGNSVYQNASGVTVRCRLQISADENVKQGFNHEFYWRGMYHLQAHEKPNNPPPIENAAGNSSWTEATVSTNGDGYFSLQLKLVSRALYAILGSQPQPKFILELVGYPQAKTEFLFADEVGNTIFLDVRFNHNLEVKRTDPLPGAEPERRVTMKRIAEFKLYAAEDAALETRDPIKWAPPGQTVVQGSGYLAKSVSQSSNLQVPDSNAVIWNGVAQRHFLLPSFPSVATINAAQLQYSVPEVLVYRDREDTYFIRSENDQLTSFQVLLDGHRRAAQLRMKLAQEGLSPAYALEQQEWALPTVPGAHATSGLVNNSKSRMTPAIRFQPDEDLSPYASYNTEFFFHVPFLIANFLSANQRFEDAQQWFHLIFDPTTTDTTQGAQRYWRYLPFRKYSETKPIDELLKILGDPTVPSTDVDRQKVAQQIEIWSKNPFRPHAVARLRPRAYQFAVFFKYVSNLLEWGDQLFRQYTTESINEATQLYILASKLLGERPQTVPRTTSPSPLTYARVAGKWDQFSNAWTELEANLPDSASVPSNNFVRGNVTSPISTVGTLYFCVPRNEKMLEYWTTLDKRLFNIRHCRNIEGVEQPVPLFQPAIDPALLVRAVAAGLDIGAVLAEANTSLPYYRFGVLAQKATELCGELKSLGSALLSALEKKDAEVLSLLRSNQELELSRLVRTVREQQLEEAKANIESLRQSEKLAAVRFAQYQRLLGSANTNVPDDDTADIEQTSSVRPGRSGDSGEFSGLGLTKAEQDQIQWSDAAVSLGTIAGTHSILSGVLYAVPDISVGSPWINSKFGGTNLGSILSAGAAMWSGLERIATHQSNRSATIGQYQRRQDEWVFQSRLALREVQQIRKQIIAAEIRSDIATKELSNHDKQIKDAEETDRFMREKYANRELYQWMVQQISGVYFRSYQLARDVAKRAERAFRFELGVNDSNYIQFGYWDNLKKGLLAGEKLSHDLKRMEVAYLDQNKREYEITKHVSLRSVDPMALIMLRETGQCEIPVPEALFDLDFPGHYLRRIKSIGLTIPCVTGPYTGVNCTLKLLSSRIRHATRLDGGYERDTSGEGDDRFTEGFGVAQSVVTTTAQNDSGLFEINMRDERYLPFEGAGVDSAWLLELPSEIRQFDYGTISDVILHIRYTSRDGGPELKDAAKALISRQIGEAAATGMAHLFSVRHAFPDAWTKFLNETPGANRRYALTLDLREEHYPYWSKGRLNSVEQVEVMARSTQKPVPDRIDVFENVVISQADNKKGTLSKDDSFGGLLRGQLTSGLPARPDGQLELFFNNKALADLWIVLTWSE